LIDIDIDTIGKIGSLLWFVALSFRNGLEYWNTDGRIKAQWIGLHPVQIGVVRLDLQGSFVNISNSGSYCVFVEFFVLYRDQVNPQLALIFLVASSTT